VAAGAVGLALSPDGARLYVTNPPNGTLQIVDPASLAVMTLTGLGRPRNVAFNATGTTALVTNEFGKVIVIC
jgi:YVTN family beta-propeller protein